MIEKMLDEEDDFRPAADDIHKSIMGYKKGGDKLAMSLNGSFMVNSVVK